MMFVPLQTFDTISAAICKSIVIMCRFLQFLVKFPCQLCHLVLQQPILFGGMKKKRI